MAMPANDLTLPRQALPESFLSPALDGSQGSNRASGGFRQIAANTDVEAIRLWLAEYADSPHTLRSYRKEAVRLLLWANHSLGKPFSSLTREDLLAYEAFLAQPHGDWSNPLLPRTGADRRLFDGPLSPRSIGQAMGILSGLFGYLVAAGYLRGNPLALRRRKSSRNATDKVGVERYLEQELWQAVLDFIDNLPRETTRDCQHYERLRWLFRLLYGASLRVSEAADAQTSDLLQRRGNWWLRVQGKGGRVGDVPVSAQLMADWVRYRQFHGLPTVPNRLDSSPLVLSITGNPDRALTPAAIYLLVKKVFLDLAGTLEASNPVAAAKLRSASTHWLRHTSATHQADAGNDIRFIQRNLRHVSIETTAIYLHVDDDARHASTTGDATQKP